MKSVFVGSNEFVRCANLISIKGKSLFSFGFPPAPTTVDLNIPSPTYETEIRVKNSSPVTMTEHLLTAVKSEEFIATWDGQQIFTAVFAGNEILVEMDFRPLDLDIWTESGVLRIGQARLSKNRFNHAGTGRSIG
jgi:hypothetical protein